MNGNQRPPGFQIRVDLAAIPDMECYCGNSDFMQTFKLKYITPLQCGDPKGGSAQIMRWECRHCGQAYSGAMKQEEIDKIKADVLKAADDVNLVIDEK